MSALSLLFWWPKMHQFCLINILVLNNYTEKSELISRSALISDLEFINLATRRNLWKRQWKLKIK
jgi:hypothetical protein